MAISGISAAANYQPPGAQASQTVGQHRHGGRHFASLSDIDALGSSVATPPSSTGKIGSKVDVTA